MFSILLNIATTRPRYVPISSWSLAIWIHALCNTAGAVIAAYRLITKKAKSTNPWYGLLFLGAIPSLGLRYYNGHVNWTHMASILNMLAISAHYLSNRLEKPMPHIRAIVDIWLTMSLIVGGLGGVIRHSFMDRYIPWESASLILSVILGPIVGLRIYDTDYDSES